MLPKRTKPGQPPYWTAPGGGIKESDSSAETALRRELREELGATASDVSLVFRSGDGVAMQHFFLARLVSLDESARNGPEFHDPSRGGYELDRVDLRSNDLAAIDVKPVALKAFLLANHAMLLGEAAGGHGNQWPPATVTPAPPPATS